MFERLREAIKEHRQRRGKSTGSIWESGLITAVSAGSAGTVAAIATTPIDVVKTRIMLSAVDSSGTSASKGAKSGKTGLVDAFGKSVDASKGALKGAATRSLNPLQSVRAAAGKKSLWAVGREIVVEKGYRGLWRGGVLRGVWTFVGSGLYLGVYDCGRIYLVGRRGEEVNEADLM